MSFSPLFSRVYLRQRMASNCTHIIRVKKRRTKEKQKRNERKTRRERSTRRIRRNSNEKNPRHIWTTMLRFVSLDSSTGWMWLEATAMSFSRFRWEPEKTKKKKNERNQKKNGGGKGAARRRRQMPEKQSERSAIWRKRDRYLMTYLSDLLSSYACLSMLINWQW